MGRGFTIIAFIFGILMTAYWFYLESYLFGTIFCVLDVVLLIMIFIPMKGGQETEQYVEA
jgi:hypothetical protein